MARILLAEDDPHTIRVMQLWLTRHKHTVIETNNGREALERLRCTSVELLISDVNMPQMTGLELVRAVRRELGLTIPILMFSSRCDHAQLADDVRGLGVDLYPKPFVPSRLCQRIEALLSPEAASPDGAGKAVEVSMVSGASPTSSAGQHGWTEGSAAS
ncbi:MAG: response regulator [Phycisphaerae bacterium]|nr:MAG: response regulator [Planctomycetota bacterium]KAB2949947.1 MAG: response regulator [Phycisphaerae bacterium]MBE7458576.1 response regulator [Planctomycetia bacterium]MCK6465033.1 response regulator [Phycisphaerae bacterium]MCL4718669.1 response regulator [Phycisphaerae bacterium]